MNKTLKKMLGGLISLSMLFSAAVIPQTALAADDDPDLLMEITFDEEGAGTGSFEATTGGTVTEHGDVAYTGSNKVLSIESNGSDNYLELPKGILNGKEAATFSFLIKPSSGWPFMTTPISGAQEYLSEKYLGMLATSSSFTAERYNNSGSRLSSVSANGTYTDWQYVTVVFEGSGTKLYVNGTLAESDTAAVNIASLFTADASTWIGHGNWGSGEGFSGMIDDFRIYGKALTEREITAMNASASENIRQKYIDENRRFIIDTHFYNGDTEIFSTDESISDVTTKISIKNYTSKDDTFTAAIYAVNADSTETKLGGASSSAKISSGYESTISLTTAASDIPHDAVKLIVKVSSADTEASYDAATMYVGVKSPKIAPADSDTTTNGAHDPSIVKFPYDDKYYVYSSHHLIFTSEDLINWTKYDFTNINAKDISPKTESFISANYTNTTMNGTYWAPDVIYKEGDDHPYWMYISVSCGLGGRNSVISLMKSNSPLFWADSNAEIVDAGVVFATKHTDDYKTNAIDANIYTDKNNNNKQYFIWGSFWGGIQAAPLNDKGFVEGIDYTSDSTILSSCKNFGTSVFTQKDGAAGPEGAWMIEHGDYRYMFTSYGWLGSNYNTRVARAENATPFSTNMGTQLVDAKGTVMGNEYTAGGTTKDKITGYKLIGSYRLGDGAMTMTHDTSNNEYYYAYSADGAHIYYGPGHNSAISTTDMGDFYVSHTRKDAIEGAAVLQIRKMLWTEDGWPVVSPVTYAGEVEQALPKDMIVGTYDLASVGQTKMEGNSIYTGKNPNRNYDLPVVSSKVTLNEDGTMADGLGTWTFDGNHTITLTFAKDGDESKDEFYKSRDVMTMYALFGYDKDEQEAVIGLTGTDQNHITQLAKKSLSNTFMSESEKVITPITVDKSAGGNPILGFDASGNTLYAGDPAAFVEGDTVYLYAGHDTSTGNSYVMPEWVCYSSKDMESWTYEGVIMKATDVSWRNNDTSAWASQVIKHNGKYYLYYCTWDKNDTFTNSEGKTEHRQSIGVAVSDSPTGPFKDIIGTPLINGGLTEPQTSGWNDIDPTVWVETVDGEEHRYLAWGNGIFYVCELNEDMMSVKDLNGDNQIKMNDDIKQQTIKNASLNFTEAPWIYRQQDENGNYYGKYYLFYAAGWREQMAYATTDDLSDGQWDFGGILMPPTATSNTNHPSVIDFKGKTYFIYHNGSLPWGSGFRRSVCVEEFTINDDGSIDPIQETSTGISGTASIITQNDSFLHHEYFVNSGSDDSYPITAAVSVDTNVMDIMDTFWEILPGKADKTNENYVSIQSVNKPGLYLCANDDKTVVLTQDSTNDTTGTVAKKMTFRTVAGLNGSENSVSFESVSQPGYFITKQASGITLTKGGNSEACTFGIAPASEITIPGMLATIDKIWYENNKTVHFRLNNAAIYGTVNAYVAEYDASGKLIGVAPKNNIDITASSQFIDIDYARKESDSTLRLFVWNHMQPIAAVTEVTDTESPYTVPDNYTSYYSFDDNMTNSVTNTAASTVGWSDSLAIGSRITTAKSQAASYAEGYKGKAVSFSGINSDGINLGNAITNSKYTISFRMKANEFTQFTSGVFITSGDGNSNQKWVSAPFGSQANGNTMVWSNNGGYISMNSSAVLNTDTWYQITITADGSQGKMYVNGTEAASGSVAEVITSDTNTYLGVNYWDTPFNGLIDELYVYDGTALTAEQVENLYFATQN